MFANDINIQVLQEELKRELVVGAHLLFSAHRWEEAWSPDTQANMHCTWKTHYKSRKDKIFIKKKTPSAKILFSTERASSVVMVPYASLNK